jgi:site-specific DNA-methyltransferase (adenine-specific)
MREEAAKTGLYRGGNGRDYPKLQILTVSELLDGRKRPEFPDMSMGALTFKKAKRERSKAAEAPKLFEPDDEA